MVWEQRIKQRRTFLNMDENDNFDVDLARLNEANNEAPIDKNLLRKGTSIASGFMLTDFGSATVSLSQLLSAISLSC